MQILLQNNLINKKDRITFSGDESTFCLFITACIGKQRTKGGMSKKASLGHNNTFEILYSVD